jgi:muramoyltetrapeptide carboxypeptidase LdcA involved in peptidoglycan recycling
MSELVPASARIAVVSPANQASVFLPRRLELGLERLRLAGFEPKLMPTAASSQPYPSPRARARDLIAAYSDPDVVAVVATVGGNSATTVLSELDPSTFTANRKPFQGGSDATCLLWWLQHHCDIPALYGPMVALGLAEVSEAYQLSWDGMRRAWSGRPFVCRPSEGWTEELVEIGAPAGSSLDLQRRGLTNATKWNVLRPGIARGKLLVGCLEVLVWWVRDTPSWQLLTRSDVVLVLDIALPGSRWRPSGSIGGPQGVESLLYTFGRCGGWQRVSGLIVGRPRGYTDDERVRLAEILLRSVPGEVPVLTDFDLGHTEPSWTLPLGVDCVLDTEEPALHIGQ